MTWEFVMDISPIIAIGLLLCCTLFYLARQYVVILVCLILLLVLTLVFAYLELIFFRDFFAFLLGISIVVIAFWQRIKAEKTINQYRTQGGWWKFAFYTIILIFLVNLTFWFSTLILPKADVYFVLLVFSVPNAILICSMKTLWDGNNDFLDWVYFFGTAGVAIVIPILFFAGVYPGILPEAKQVRKFPSDLKNIQEYCSFAAEAYSLSQEENTNNTDKNTIIRKLNNDDFYFLRTNLEVQILSIRGSDSPGIWLEDANIAISKHSNTKIGFHTGFLKGAQIIYYDIKAELKEKINKDKPLVLVGHSYGGAVAVVLSLLMKQDGYNIKKVVTFGQPKVTTRNYLPHANKIIDYEILRVVYCKDPVSMAPPGEFEHFGNELILLNKGCYIYLPENIVQITNPDKIISSPFTKLCVNLFSHPLTSYEKDFKSIEKPIALNEREIYIPQSNFSSYLIRIVSFFLSAIFMLAIIFDMNGLKKEIEKSQTLIE